MISGAVVFTRSGVEFLSLAIQVLLYALVCILLCSLVLVVLASVAEWLYNKLFRLVLRSRQQWMLNEYDTKRKGEM